MKLKYLILFSATWLLSGCMAWAWRGYNPPAENDFVKVGGPNNCMEIGKQNLDATQQQAILEAAKDVCDIFSLKDFQDSVESKSWMTSCESNPPTMITGKELYSTIIASAKKYSINPKWPWHALGQTHREESRVAIGEKRIAGWYSPSRIRKAGLVGTIAHETMHIISDKFLDGGHGGDCQDNLVSYGIGEMVERFWLRTHP